MKEKKPLSLLAFISSLIAISADILTLILVEPQKLIDKVETLFKYISYDKAAKISPAIPFLQNYYEIWPLYLVFFTFLVTITYFEFKNQIIPDEVTIPGVIIGVGLVAGFKHISLLSSISGALIGFLFPWAVARYYKKITGLDGLGGGVIKMQSMIGAFLGIKVSIFAFVIACILGTIYGLIRTRGASDRFNQTIELGPLLALSSLLVIFTPIVDFLYSFHK